MGAWTVGAPTAAPGRIRPEDRPRFEEHASAEAIEVRLRQAKAACSAAQRDVEWLSELLGRRKAETAAGVWPTKREEAPDA